MKLKHKASLAIFILSSFLLALLAGGASYYSQQDAQRDALANLEMLSQELASRLVDRIDKYISISTVLANSPEIRQAVIRSNGSLAWLDPHERRQIIDEYSNVWAGLHDLQDSFILERTDNDIARAFRQQIETFQGEFGQIFLTNEYGLIIAASEKIPSLAQANKRWWIVSQDGGTGKLHLEDMGYIASIQGFMLGVAVPVRAQDRFIGALKSNINIQKTISELVASFNRFYNVNARLVRSDGSIIHGQGDIPLNTNSSGEFARCLSNEASSLTVTASGKAYMAGCAPVALAISSAAADGQTGLASKAGAGWHIVLLQDLDTATQQGQQTVRAIMMTGLVIILFASLLAWLVGSLSARPIENLASVARRIGEGDLDARAEATTRDETGMLAESINQMTANLKSTLASRDEIAREVKRREEAEKQLLFLSTSVEQAKEAISITNTEGIIEYINPAFTELTGYSQSEAIGKSQGILKSGLQSGRFFEKMWHDIRAGAAWSGRIENRRKDGSHYPAMMTISPIVGENGNVSHFVSTQQSLTEYEELENHLRQTQKMEAVGVLVGGIAHDFNNMLAGIIGNLYLAKRKADSPYLLGKLENIEALSFRASGMIKRLLTFARKDMVEMKPFGLTSFIKETSKLNRASIPENIALEINLCQKELLVYGDPTQLQQVIINLLSNAYDAVAEVERPEIRLRLEEFTANQEFYAAHPDIESSNFAHLIVEDNGCGISDEDKEHIFEPFFTTKEVGSGSGLGLSMAYGSIKSHSGVIEVENSSGQGVAFHIYLPIINEEEDAFVPHADSDQALRGQGETILVVDDNEVVRLATREVLESIGYRVLEAEDGVDAVSKFAAHRSEIALIIMDVVMPKMGGAKAVKRIKDTAPRVKVIYATGYNKDEVLEKDIQGSEYPVLSKPFVIENLSRLIRQQLDS